MSKKRSITAEFEIVTPMFLGGADHHATRIRESSIKGALVFWWRALNYARYVQMAQDSHAAALGAMQADEQRLFGGPDGQGVFLLRVTGPELDTALASGILADGQLTYFGYGLVDQNNNKDPKGFLPGQNFTLTLMFARRTRPADIEQIEKAVRVFGLLGGLGSRSRRGWGSVSLSELSAEGLTLSHDMQTPTSIEAYGQGLRSLLPKGKLEDGYDFPITAFASKSHIRIGNSVKSAPLGVMSDMQSGLQRYRGWYRPGEANFVADHNWFKTDQDDNRQENQRQLNGAFAYEKDGQSKQIDASRLPERAAFGLPHNYFSNKPKRIDGVAKRRLLKMNIDVVDRPGGDDKQARRASPLFFHVQKLDGHRYAGVMAYFPTRFLNGQDMKIFSSVRETRGHGDKEKPNNKTGYKNYNFDPKTIENFLTGVKPGTGERADTPYFPSQRIFPVSEVPS